MNGEPEDALVAIRENSITKAAVGADWLIRPENTGVYAFKQPRNRRDVNGSVAKSKQVG